MSDGDLYEQGLRMRRQVLGAEHVDRSLANASDFARPLQEMVTTNCWGGIWTRPGLTLRERSLINIGMLTAMGRLHKLRWHVRGALNNGATRESCRRCSSRRLCIAAFRPPSTQAVPSSRSSTA